MGSNRYFISIIIMKLLINLILWYYYSRSVYDCVLRPKMISARSLMNLKMFKQSHKKHWHEKILPWPFWCFLLLFVFSTRRSIFDIYLLYESHHDT